MLIKSALTAALLASLAAAVQQNYESTSLLAERTNRVAVLARTGNLQRVGIPIISQQIHNNAMIISAKPQLMEKRQWSSLDGSSDGEPANEPDYSAAPDTTYCRDGRRVSSSSECLGNGGYAWSTIDKS
jgi:hypothetical protein